MKTMICSETLLLPTGPQLEKERAFFPDRASGPIGRGALEVLKAWCEVRMEGVQVLEMWPKSGEASLPCSVGPRSLYGQDVGEARSQALIHRSAWKGYSPKLVLVTVERYADSSRRRLRWRRVRARAPHWEPHQAAEWFFGRS
jgi:hypothetical protein